MVTFFLFSGTIQSTPILQVLLVFLWFYGGRKEAYGRIDCRKWLVYFLILNYLISKTDFLKCSLVTKYMYIVISFSMNIYSYKEGKDTNYKKKM